MSTAPQIKTGLKYKLQFQRGSLAGQSMTFDKPVVQIGRGTENDLILLNDLRASRLHAEIRWDGNDLHIANVSAKNFIAVNGSQVEFARLEPGSMITVGESEFRIDFAIAAEIAEPKTKVVSDPGEPVIVQMPVLQATRPAPLQPSMAPIQSFPQTPATPQGGVMGGAGSLQPNYGSNLPGNMGSTPRPRSSKKRPVAKGGDSGKTRFYIIVAVIGIGFVWLMNSTPTKPKELTLRSTDQIEKDIEASREEVKEFEARKEKLDNVQYKRAQENYIRGFRDYKQGNYGRARESFQVVLNLDPDNELAKRYYQLARLKFDELVKFHMLQGNRYREKKNWRMCKSSYFNVMTMVNNNQDPVFKEAKQYYDQCSMAQEGRY